MNNDTQLIWEAFAGPTIPSYEHALTDPVEYSLYSNEYSDEDWDGNTIQRTSYALYFKHDRKFCENVDNSDDMDEIRDVFERLNPDAMENF